MASANFSEHGSTHANRNSSSSSSHRAEQSDRKHFTHGSKNKYSHDKTNSGSRTSYVRYNRNDAAEKPLNDKSKDESKETSNRPELQDSVASSSSNTKRENHKEYQGYKSYDKSDSKVGYSSKDSYSQKSHSKKSFHESSSKYYRHFDKPRKSMSDVQISDNLHRSSHEAAQSELKNVDNQDAMGTVINGRYMRKSSLQSSLSHNMATDVPHVNTSSHHTDHRSSMSYQGTKHKYGEKMFKNSNNFRSFEPVNHNVFQRRTYRNDNCNDHTYHNSKYIPNKNFGRKRSNSFKHSNGDLNFQEDLYILDDSTFDDSETQNGDSNGEKFLGRDGINKDLQFSAAAVKEDSTQRDRLIDQLEKGECECMVCCEQMRTRDQVWNCSSCYHVFHLRCIKKWARSPTAVVLDCGWRCPACQNVSEKVPYNYYCFCGKTKEPEVNLHYTPHSCGEVCGKQRDDKNCTHRCTLLCHPGPCPTCSATVTRSCACSKTKKIVPCSHSDPITCDLSCEKILNCGMHRCPEKCHVGNCNPCSVVVKQKCFCGRNEREVLCDVSNVGGKEYCCNMVCNKKLHCGYHNCFATCHAGPCAPCALLPSVVLSCPCGKHLLQELYEAGKAQRRKSCVDPIPTCEEKCEKLLSCGPKGNPHKCSISCHTDECPPCPLVTSIKCQCGSTSKEIPCTEAASSFVFQCEKRCNRRKDCGRHKCLNHCCVNKEHRCELICNKKLSCGVHHCQEMCHAGKCPNCWNVSFDELRCHCGKSVHYPPIHCGTKPPECNEPCSRTHSCDHDVVHTCHSEEKCPPCTAFTVKWCFGRHERRSHVPCFLDGISCGKPCDKPLPCGRHKCRETCHVGPCLKENNQCAQLCETPRACGHPCATPCHDGECPDTACKAKINVSCPCGHRTEVATCSENGNGYRLMSVSLLATKMQDIKAGESVNINDLLGKKSKGKNRLQCNEECAVIERNKRLAVALQIQNPELSCKPGPPNYSEFLKEEAKKNIRFVCNVYDKFTELVQLAKQSKQKSRSYAFPSMNRDQRRVIHEMAEFFGCETQSYDEEPVKNVVITASRDKSWLPFVSLAAVVQREMGLRKGPAPLISQNALKTSVQTTLPERKEKPIDYFDFPG